MAYDPSQAADLSTITGDKDSNQFADIDPLGGAVFGWGNRAYNNEIARKNAKLAALRAQVGEERFAAIKNAVEQNGGDWAALGIDLDKLPDTYAGIEDKDQGALQDLLGGLGDYTNSADFFKDPNFMGDVGDITNSAVPSSETLSNQRGALQQFKNLSTPTETAQEKLIRMMANKEMESNLQGDREALNRSLKARGVYGSGAEITGNMMSQGQQADRAALSNAQANAQASQRAMAALGSYSDLAGKMRASETGEGSLANQVAQFNNATNQQLSNQRAGAQVAATQAGEAAKGQRAVQGFTGSTNVNNAQRGDVGANTTAQQNYVQGKTTSNTQGTGMLAGAYDKEDDALKSAIAQNDAKKKTSLLGIG